MLGSDRLWSAGAIMPRFFGFKGIDGRRLIELGEEITKKMIQAVDIPSEIKDQQTARGSHTTSTSARNA